VRIYRSGKRRKTDDGEAGDVTDRRKDLYGEKFQREREREGLGSVRNELEMKI